MRKFISLLMILFTVLSGCKSKDTTRKSLPESEEEVYNVIFDLKRLEQKELEVKAKEVELRGETTFVYNFMINFFDSKGNITSELYADSGFIIETKGVMTAYGSIKVYSQEGDSLYASKLTWEEKKELIYSDEPVTLFKGGKIIKAQGLESDPALRHITLKGKVYGEG